MKKITIIDYDCGNILNLVRAIKFLGYKAEITHEKKNILNSSHVILPGVGAFGNAMNQLELYNLKNTILDKKGKLFHLKNAIKEKNIKKNLTLAIGDGDNDIDMIRFSSLGIAWNAYKKVRLVADVSIGITFNVSLHTLRLVSLPVALMSSGIERYG